MALCNDKGPIPQEELAILNVYLSNNKTAKYFKQKQFHPKTDGTERTIEKSTITAEDVNTPL